MKKLTVLMVSLMVPLIMATGASALLITVYTDKAAWSLAVGGQFKTETFTDNLLHDPGVTFSAGEQGKIVNEHYQDVLNVISGNPAETTWQFAPNILAFGGNWDLNGPGGNNLHVTLVDFGIEAGIVGSYYAGGFWGFTSDTPFSQVKLTGGLGEHERHYYLDDMVYSSVVPVPGAIWLLAGGLLGMISLRRRF